MHLRISSLETRGETPYGMDNHLVNKYITGNTFSTFWAVISAPIDFIFRSQDQLTKVGYSLAVKPHSGMSTEAA